jgi:hypothetical protein
MKEIMLLNVSGAGCCCGSWTGVHWDVHTQSPLSDICDISLSTAHCLQDFEMVNSITNHQIFAEIEKISS